jgi:hypothetical protein
MTSRDWMIHIQCLYTQYTLVWVDSIVRTNTPSPNSPKSIPRFTDNLSYPVGPVQVPLTQLNAVPYACTVPRLCMATACPLPAQSPVWISPKKGHLQIHET